MTRQDIEYGRRRLLARVRCNGDCVEWAGPLTNVGYGRISLGRKWSDVLAHRLSYEALVGNIPEGMMVLHRCDNRRCVLPDHLFLGTNDDNMRDRDSKGRQCRGSRHGMAKLSDTDVAEIRSRRAAGEMPKDIAMSYGMSVTAVRRIISRAAWSHI